MLQLFDADVRLGTSLFGYQLDSATLLAMMERNGIARALVHPVRPRDSDLRAANDLVRDAVRASPDRLTGFARVDPWLGDDAIVELRRAIREGGLRGLSLDPWEDHYDIASPMLDPLIDAATSLRIPVMVAGGYPQFSHPSQIAALARRHPTAQFIATHGGQINISGLLLADAQIMLRSAANVMINTSGVYREDYIEDCVEEFGAERVIFGSGAPIFQQDFETRRIHLAHFSDTIKQQVGFDNIERLLS
jgi:predicted TIM-barrel fold metal-dependent hydrolase